MSRIQTYNGTKQSIVQTTMNLLRCMRQCFPRSVFL